jgi:hypothetical protein
MMIRRHAYAALEAAIHAFPVVGLLGPRQVGKTTLALDLAERLGTDKVQYLDLEAPADRARLADPATYLESQEGRLVILDEIHRTPDLFRTLRGIVDQRRRRGLRTGQFLVLGSASLDLLQQSAESLAGRIIYLELSPLRVDEVASDRRTLDALWVRGGFPDSFLAASDRASRSWRDAFIRTYLERDIPQLGPRIPAETLRRFWTMLAHAQAQPVNAAQFAAGLGVSGQTVARYLDLLVDLLLVRRLPPWSGNVRKRLVRSPRVYVRDSGVAHALLNLTSLHDVLGHPVAGASWEGMVIESLIGAAGATPAYYYRTSAGAEIDLVFEISPRERIAIEIKRSSTPSLSRGFWSACEDLAVSQAVVVHAGSGRFPLGREVEALSVREAVQWVPERVGRK